MCACVHTVVVVQMLAVERRFIGNYQLSSEQKEGVRSWSKSGLYQVGSHYSIIVYIKLGHNGTTLTSLTFEVLLRASNLFSEELEQV